MQPFHAYFVCQRLNTNCTAITVIALPVLFRNTYRLSDSRRPGDSAPGPAWLSLQGTWRSLLPFPFTWT